MEKRTENLPLLLKQLRGILRDGDITILVQRTGLSRQTIHKLLKGEAITDNTQVLRAAAKELMQEHHQQEKNLIAKL